VEQPIWEQSSLLESPDSRPTAAEPAPVGPSDQPQPAAVAAEASSPAISGQGGGEPADPHPRAAQGRGITAALPPLPAKRRPPVAGGSSPSAAAAPTAPCRLLILDTETTALSPEQGHCIEVGAVLFDVASRSVLMQVSFLMPCERNPAQAINGIPAAVSRLPQPWTSGLACFQAMVDSADALLAHNAAFDRQWFGGSQLPAIDKPWICSMEDIRWPAERQLRPNPSVRDLALAYGVPVWAAHRALTDCIYLVQVLQRCEDPPLLLQAALEPRTLVRARLSYDDRQLAKDAGFRWNDPVRGAWSRRLSDREIAALPFPVDAVNPDPVEFSPGDGPWRRSA
jgi:DNA polymerase III subunit epsilon